MTSRYYTVEISPEITDCFIIFALEHTNKYLVPYANAPVLMRLFLPMEICVVDRARNCSPTSGCIIDDVAKQRIFAAALLASPHSSKVKDGRIRLGPQFAKDIGINEGDIVSCVVAAPQKDWRVANKIEVSPVDVNESEVVEKHALTLQNCIMQSLRVLFPGQTVTLRTPTGIRARVKVINGDLLSPAGAACYVLTDGTEVHVACKIRETENVNSETLPPTLMRLICSPPSLHSTDLSNALIVDAEVATAQTFTEGMTVGVINLRDFVHEKTYLGSSSNTGVEGADEKVSGPGLFTPGFIKKHGTVFTVHITKEKVDKTAQKCLSSDVPYCFIPELETESSRMLLPTNLYVVPYPGDHYKQNPPSVLLNSAEPGTLEKNVPADSLELTAEDVEAVHGCSLWSELFACVAPSRDEMCKNVLLCGPCGTGTTALACTAARSSGRHVVFVDVAAIPANKLKSVMLDAVAECNLCSPSVLVMDNLSAVASSAPQGPGQGPTTITPGTERLLQEWLTSTAKPNRVINSPDIVVIATAEEFENLHEIVKTPACFSTIIKVSPLLSAEQKVALIKQRLLCSFCTIYSKEGDRENFIDKCSTSLAAMAENYVASDIAALCARTVRYLAVESTHKNIDDLISPEALKGALESFIPRSRMGLKFMTGPQSRPFKWEDAGGLREAKAALHDILVLPAKYPQIFAKLPLKAQSGILLSGPSGCGKSYIVQVAVSAENLHCIVVNGPEIFGKYIGTSEQKIREIFEAAQAAAPCVVFFDAFESVAPRRGDSNTGVTDRVVNQLLCYLDGVEGRKDVYVVAATSRPDMIDPALTRPGRLDRTVECPMPSFDDRIEVFEAQVCRTLPQGESSALSADDLRVLSEETDGWTCADIAGLIGQANNTLMQSFLKLTSDELLKAISEKTDENDLISRDGFEILPGVVGEESKKAYADAVQRHKESVKRSGIIQSQEGIASSNTERDIETQLAKPPKLTREHIESAMEKFNRSRESQNAGKVKVGSKANQLRLMQQLMKQMGTRETSA